MRCSQCGYEQPTGKHCEMCGAPLAQEQDAALGAQADAGSSQGQESYDPYQNQGSYNPYQNNGQPGGAPPYPGYPQHPAYPPYGMQDPTVEKAKKQARQSMIFGIISIFVFGLVLGIPALVFGIQSRKVLKAAGQSTGNATAGIVCGIIGIIGWIWVISTWF